MADVSPKDRELLLLSYFLRNPAMLRNWSGRLDSRHWEYPAARLLYGIFSHAIKKSDQLPTQVELQIALEDAFRQSSLESLIVNQIKDTATFIYEQTVTEATGESLGLWIASREIQTIGDKMKAVTPDQVFTKLSEFRKTIDELSLLGAGPTSDSGGISIFSRKELAPDNLQEAVQQLSGLAIPSGFPSLDFRLGGGVYLEELLLIGARSGKGKTLFLTNWTWSAAQHGYRTIYFPIGDAKAREVQFRFYARAAEQPTDELEGRDYTQFSRDLLDSANGGHELVILKEFPPNRVTARDIQRFIRSEREKYRRLDLAAGVPAEHAGHIEMLVFDYPDLMLSENKANEKSHERLPAILIEILAVLKEEHCAGIAVTQFNGDGYKTGRGDVSWLQGAKSKIDQLSHLFFWTQTPEEEAMGEGVLYCEKTRRSSRKWQKRYCLSILIDPVIQRLSDNPRKAPWVITDEDEPKAARQYRKKNEQGHYAVEEPRGAEQDFDAQLRSAFANPLPTLSSENPLNLLNRR